MAKKHAKAASGAKKAASGAAAGRTKDRLQVHGCRVWVWPSDKENVEAALKKKREGKKSWTRQAWNACVEQEIKTNWLGKPRGGYRVPMVAQAPEAPTAASGAEKVGDSENGEQPAAVSTRAKYVLEHVRSSSTATYDATGAVVCLKVPIQGFDHIPFVSQPVVNWLYQVLGRVLYETQNLLGVNKRFHPDGVYRDALGAPASGGQVVAFWGTELGARREQALIAWDYDVDVAVFKTPDCDFSVAWTDLRGVLEPLGLRCHEHTPGSLRHV